MAAAQLSLALDAAPEIVRAHGLRAAHAFPLVGRRRADGSFYSWRTTPKRAWVERYIQLESAGSAYAGLIFDCDDVDSMTAGLFELPPVNWKVWTERGAHCAWCLAAPVHRYPEARTAPLSYLRRAAEYYAAALGADPGYVHCLTRNPCNENASVTWGRENPYSLRELAAVIPFNWKAPRISQTGIGRNVDLFNSGMRWAGKKENMGTPVLTALHIANSQFDNPLADSEVAATARSIERYRERWAAHGWHSIAWLARQRARGRRGGRPRRFAPGAEPWTAAGISRAAWYRRQRAT